jgi:predicted transcriptional regulator
MKSEQEILDVLFPKVRAQILRSLFGRPNRQRYVRELARESGLALSTVQEELCKLSAIGLVTSYSNGFYRFYCPAGGHPLAREIRRIVELSPDLPKMKPGFLRKKASRRRKPARGDYHGRMRPDRPINWDLFSPRRKT